MLIKYVIKIGNIFWKPNTCLIIYQWDDDDGRFVLDQHV
jgi:hypothetical protein